MVLPATSSREPACATARKVREGLPGAVGACSDNPSFLAESASSASSVQGQALVSSGTGSDGFDGVDLQSRCSSGMTGKVTSPGSSPSWSQAGPWTVGVTAGDG